MRALEINVWRMFCFVVMVAFVVTCFAGCGGGSAEEPDVIQGEFMVPGDLPSVNQWVEPAIDPEEEEEEESNLLNEEPESDNTDPSAISTVPSTQEVPCEGAECLQPTDKVEELLNNATQEDLDALVSEHEPSKSEMHLALFYLHYLAYASEEGEMPESFFELELQGEMEALLGKYPSYFGASDQQVFQHSVLSISPGQKPTCHTSCNPNVAAVTQSVAGGVVQVVLTGLGLSASKKAVSAGATASQKVFYEGVEEGTTTVTTLMSAKDAADSWAQENPNQVKSALDHIATVAGMTGLVVTSPFWKPALAILAAGATIGSAGYAIHGAITIREDCLEWQYDECHCDEGYYTFDGVCIECMDSSECSNGTCQGNICIPETCGNGQLDLVAGEKCDSSGFLICPEDPSICGNDPCRTYYIEGDPAKCNAQCASEPIVCNDGLICVEGECKDPDSCDLGGTCEWGLECIDGECVEPKSCDNGGTCEEGLVCVDGACVEPDQCESVTCDEGYECIDGQCISPENCGNGVLDPGELCDPESTTNPCPYSANDCQFTSSECVEFEVEGNPNECTAQCVVASEVVCAEGEICSKGECEEISDTNSCGFTNTCCPAQDNSCVPEGAQCYCDEYCLTANDCCSDYIATCGGGGGGSGAVGSRRTGS